MALLLATCWRALRARQWAHFALLPCCALPPPPWGGSLAGALPGALPEVIARVFRGVLVACSALAYAYGLNAITDRDMDASSDKNPLAGLRAGLVDLRAPLALTLCAGALALALAATSGPGPLAASAASVTASTLYSAGPRLKARLLLGTLCNVAIFAPLLLVSLPAAGPPRGFAHLAAAFTGLLLQNQLLHERADRVEDACGRVRTTASALGERGAAWAVAGVGAAAALACALLAPSAASALASTAALAAGGAAAFPIAAPAAARRARHRLLAIAGGAAVFLAGWAGPP